MFISHSIVSTIAAQVAELAKPHEVEHQTATAGGGAPAAGHLFEPGDEICPPWPWPPGPWPGPWFDNVLEISQLKQMGQQR